MDIQITDRANRSDHRPVHTHLRLDYLLFGNSVPNCQQHCCAPRSNGFGHALSKERDHSFGHCISCQPNGVADVRGEDSGHPSEFFPFLKGNLIHTHVHVLSQHQKYSSFID